MYNNEYRNGIIDRDMLLVCILYQFIFFILKIYILRFVAKFLNFIKELPPAHKTQLMLYDNQPVEIIYW